MAENDQDVQGADLEEPEGEELNPQDESSVVDKTQEKDTSEAAAGAAAGKDQPKVVPLERFKEVEDKLKSYAALEPLRDLLVQNPAAIHDLRAEIIRRQMGQGGD